MRSRAKKRNTWSLVIAVAALFILVNGFLWYRYQASQPPEPDVEAAPESDDRVLPESGLENPPRAVFLGDSFTEGAVASSPDFGYIKYAGGVAGLDARPAAQGGTGILTDGGGQDNNRKFRDRLADDVFLQNPDVVVVAGGLNDSGGLGSRFTLEQYRSEYDALLAELKEGLPDAQIVVLGPFSPGSPQNRPELVAIRDATEASAQVAGIPFIDAFYFDDENKSTYISEDGVHPNDAGHRYLGEKVGEDLAEVLR